MNQNELIFYPKFKFQLLNSNSTLTQHPSVDSINGIFCFYFVLYRTVYSQLTTHKYVRSRVLTIG
jgi:hypothetical protein